MADLEQRKIFIGGLSPDTTEDSLREYFQGYGSIERCNVKYDMETQRSKCYGFITFDDANVVAQVISESHMVDGKSCDAKRATKQKTFEPPRSKKVFVGGVPNDISEEEMQKHFQTFGEVEEVVFPIVPETQRRRGFAFIVFVSEDSAELACQEKNQELGQERKSIEVKPATPRPERGGRGGGKWEYVRLCIVPAATA